MLLVNINRFKFIICGQFIQIKHLENFEFVCIIMIVQHTFKKFICAVGNVDC